MTEPLSHVLADHNHPILFRTMGKDVFQSTVEAGSVWLRSDQYYREIEDKVRQDRSEGFNGGGCTIPLRLPLGGASAPLTIVGEGMIGQTLPPHYILSLHGSSISAEQHSSFGGFTVGVKSALRLAEEIYVKAKEVIGEHRWFFQQVAYQRTALTVTATPLEAAPITFGNPPMHLSIVDATPFRKDPVWPFVEQDEWRIVLGTEGYLSNDPYEPLRINVDPGLFYPYLQPQ